MKRASATISRTKFRCQHRRQNGLPCNAIVPGATKGFCYLHDPKTSTIVFERDYGKFKEGESMNNISNDEALPYIESGHAIYLADFYERLAALIDETIANTKKSIRQDDQETIIRFMRGKRTGNPPRKLLLRFVNTNNFTADERTYLRRLMREQGWLDG